MLAKSQKTRPFHLLSRLFRTIWGSGSTGRVCETGPPGASHIETIWMQILREHLELAGSWNRYILEQKIKLRSLRRNSFLRLLDYKDPRFKTFKPRILIIAEWEF